MHSANLLHRDSAGAHPAGGYIPGDRSRYPSRTSNSKVGKFAIQKSLMRGLTPIAVTNSNARPTSLPNSCSSSQCSQKSPVEPSFPRYISPIAGTYQLKSKFNIREEVVFSAHESIPETTWF